MPGSNMVATRNIGGHRDQLDGRDVHAGDGVDLWDDGLWVAGRYEFKGRTGEAWFVYTTDRGDEAVLDIDRETMRFRWPPRY